MTCRRCKAVFHAGTDKGTGLCPICRRIIVDEEFGKVLK